MDEECTCGHVEDEHGANGSCTIEGCECGGFEPIGDDDEEDGDLG